MIDGFGTLKGAHIDNQIGQRVEIGDGSSIAHARSFDAQFFGLAVDPFAGSALGINGVIQGTPTIQGHALDAAEFAVEILDTAFAFGELGVRTGLASSVGKEQRALETLSAKAVGMVELHGGMHGQVKRTQRGSITQAFKRCFGGLSERNSGNAALTSGSLVDVPCIIGSISSKMGGIVTEGNAELAV